MLRTFILAGIVGASLASGAAGQSASGGEDAPEAEQPLQPVVADDLAPNLGEPDDVPLQPVLQDDAAPVPGEPGDVPLRSVVDDDGEESAPTPRVEAQSGARYRVTLSLRPDGSRPAVRVEASANGRDAEVWIDGALRVILKNKAGLGLDGLAVVYR